MINRSQAIVLAFFGFAWTALVADLVVSPRVYIRTRKLSNRSERIGELAFLAAISARIMVLSVSVVRRWRWTFWFVLVASRAGVLRVPASILEISEPSRRAIRRGTSCSRACSASSSLSSL